MSDKNNPPTVMNLSDKNIRRGRGRPKGSRNRVPPREQSSFTVRNVPPGTQVLLSIMADEGGLTIGQILKQAVDEYWAARQPTRNQKTEAKFAEVKKLFGIR